MDHTPTYRWRLAAAPDQSGCSHRHRSIEAAQRCAQRSTAPDMGRSEIIDRTTGDAVAPTHA